MNDRYIMLNHIKTSNKLTIKKTFFNRSDKAIAKKAINQVKKGEYDFHQISGDDLLPAIEDQYRLGIKHLGSFFSLDKAGKAAGLDSSFSQFFSYYDGYAHHQHPIVMCLKCGFFSVEKYHFLEDNYQCLMRIKELQSRKLFGKCNCDSIYSTDGKRLKYEVEGMDGSFVLLVASHCVVCKTEHNWKPKSDGQKCPKCNNLFGGNVIFPDGRRFYNPIAVYILIQLPSWKRPDRLLEYLEKIHQSE